MIPLTPKAHTFKKISLLQLSRYLLITISIIPFFQPILRPIPKRSKNIPEMTKIWTF
ncbi:hypothetical protein B279_03225 [Streptococcus equinus ATCC 33317]|nr:hypothetical protein B279_03225 [Streptococcus equinus ATCC 33317]